ncbi:HET-E [Amylocarpus encephaloides]|uniref:HET-E n=1 Tax=Amylocarpus encephaloides TaxID=45428 RepID=A0A9P7YFD4_9HELO|nr:HET-E [Amylocarpus encephaloides]
MPLLDLTSTLEGHSSSDKTIQLWDIGHSYPISSVAFSPDGKQVVSGSNDEIVHSNSIVSTSYYGEVRLWDAVTGVALKTLEGHEDSINFVSGSKDNITLEGHSFQVISVAFSLDGAALQMLEGHSFPVTSVAFSPNARQDANTGVALQTFEGHENSINCVAFSANGEQVVSGSKDGTMPECHSRLVYSVAFSPNGRNIISSSEDNTDATTGAVLQTLEYYSSLVDSITFSSDSTLSKALSQTSSSIIRLWTVKCGTK